MCLCVCVHVYVCVSECYGHVLASNPALPAFFHLLQAKNKLGRLGLRLGMCVVVTRRLRGILYFSPALHK